MSQGFTPIYTDADLDAIKKEVPPWRMTFLLR